MAVEIAPVNLLLLAIAGADRAAIDGTLEFVDLPVGDTLERPNEAIEWVYFLESGMASVVASLTETKQLEIGIIGREGMTGLAIVHGSRQSPFRTFMQVGGTALRLPAAVLVAAMEKRPAMRALFLLFSQSFAVQTGYNAVALAGADIPTRLARWLLMAHDRSETDDLHITHAFLAMMLATRRSGVSEALAILEGEHLIRGGRKQISVRNRAALEARAGRHYGSPEAEYARLLGRDPFPRLPLAV